MKIDVVVNTRGKVIATMPAVDRTAPAAKGRKSGKESRFASATPAKGGNVRVFRIEAVGDLKFDPAESAEKFHGRLSKFIKTRPDLERTE